MVNTILNVRLRFFKAWQIPLRKGGSEGYCWGLNIKYLVNPPTIFQKTILTLEGLTQKMATSFFKEDLDFTQILCFYAKLLMWENPP